MKKLASLLALLLVAGVASAQEPANPPVKPDTQKTAGVTKELAAQVVSTDLMGKTITVKRNDPAFGAGKQETTLPVEGAAVDALKTVNPGETVKLLCRTDSMGKETAVTAIQKDKPKMDKP
ncbi:MAG TPA: hypothetical protein VFM88_12915 [Vicinamibacteria bacterium]|nr:hypothetical protein [Vicinamibacteria bacterium]